MADKTEHDEVLPQHSTDKKQKNRPGTKRDLGTVGGGTIPGDDADLQKDPNINDHEKDSDISSKQANKIDRHAQSSIGGRNPGQSSTAMGDQDRTRGRDQSTNEGIADPMTSRAPHKIKPEKDAEKKP